MLKILVRTLKRNQSVLFSLDLVLDTSVSVTVVCYEVELRWNIKKLLELIQRCMEILPAYYVTHTHTHTGTPIKANGKSSDGEAADKNQGSEAKPVDCVKVSLSVQPRRSTGGRPRDDSHWQIIPH